MTKLEGIPITRAARTLYDLASTAGQRELERALAQAVSRGLTNRAALLSLFTHCSRRPGASRLRAMLECVEQAALTRSEAEDRFLALIRKADLPIPAVNVTVGGYRVDFFWRAARFAVEIDGFAFHSQPRCSRAIDAVMPCSRPRVCASRE